MNTYEYIYIYIPDGLHCLHQLRVLPFSFLPLRHFPLGLENHARVRARVCISGSHVLHRSTAVPRISFVMVPQQHLSRRVAKRVPLCSPPVPTITKLILLSVPPYLWEHSQWTQNIKNEQMNKQAGCHRNGTFNCSYIQ